MILLSDAALPPQDLNDLLQTPPGVSVPIPAFIQEKMEDLSTSFFKDGIKFTVTFGREDTHNVMGKENSPDTPDKYFPVGEGRQINRPNCGPEALSMVLRGYDLNVSSNDIEGMSNFTLLAGTSPSSLRDVAKQYGFNAVILNNSKFEEVASIIEKGGVCIALIESGTALHYVTINGFKKGGDGEKIFFISDPSGLNYSISEGDFKDSWGNVTFRGFDTGFSKSVIAIAKDDILPEERLNGKASFFNGVHGLLNSTMRNGPILFGASLFALLKIRRRESKSSDDRQAGRGQRALPAAA